MKKQFLLGIMALAALASCSKSEVLNTESLDEKGISFAAYVGKNAQTKATTIDATVAGQEGIGVLAWHTAFDQATEEILTQNAPKFMNNIKLTMDATTNKWTYSPKRYWPSTGAMVSFYAYAPYVELNPSTPYTGNDTYGRQNITIAEDENPQNEGGQYIIGLNVPANPDASNTGVEYQYFTDLMVSRKGNTTDYNNQNLNKDHEGEVNLTMKHALSKISFVAKAGDTQGEYEDAKVVIDNIKIIGKFADNGKYNMFTEKWTGLPSTPRETYNYVNTDGTDNDPFTVLADALYNNTSVEQTTLSGWYNLTKPTHDLMVIPFITEDTPASITKITGQYTVKSTATGTTYEDDVVPFETEVNINLEEGKHYIFQLDIALKVINFSVTVEPWNGPEVIDVLNPSIVKSGAVYDEASYNAVLPASYRNIPGNEWSTNISDLPWLVVQLSPISWNAIKNNITVTDSQGNTYTYTPNNASSIPDDKKMTLLTMNASELRMQTLTAGTYTVKVKDKSAIITIP